MTTFQDLEAIAVSVPCARCGALREQPCRRPDGSDRPETHRARRGPVDMAFLLGQEAVRMKCYAKGIKIDF